MNPSIIETVHHPPSLYSTKQGVKHRRNREFASGLGPPGALAEFVAGGTVDMFGKVSLVVVPGRRGPGQLKHQDRRAR